jgi:hypothetical protein
MYLSHANAGQRQRLGEVILSECIIVAPLHMSHPRGSQATLLYHGEGIRILDRPFGELQRLLRIASPDEILSEAVSRGRIFLVRIKRSLDVLETSSVIRAALVFCGLDILARVESFDP